MIFVIGNGNSRKNVNLNVLSEHGKTKKLLINIDLGNLKKVVSELYKEDK